MESRNKLTMCRLCLCENESFIDVFEVNDWDCYVAADVISDLLLFQVSESDGYPRVICSTCLSKLSEFKLFKECCHKSKVTYDDLFASKESLAERQPESDLLQDVKREFVDIAEVLEQHSQDGVRLSFLEGEGEIERAECHRRGKASTMETRLVEHWPVHGFAKSSDCEDNSNLNGDEAVHHSNKRKNHRVGDSEHCRGEPAVQAVYRQSECNVHDVLVNQYDSFIVRERIHAVPNRGKHVKSFNQAEQLIVHGFPKSSDCEMICEEDSHLSQDDAEHPSNKRKKNRVGEHFRREPTVQAVYRQSECNILDVRANRNGSFIDLERMRAVPNSGEHMTSFNQAEQLTVHGFADSSDCEVICEDETYLDQDEAVHHSNNCKQHRGGDNEHLKRNSTGEDSSRQSECNVLDVRANQNDSFIDRERMRAVPNSGEHMTSFNRAEQLTVHGFSDSSDCEEICEEDSHLSQDDAVNPSNKHKNHLDGEDEHLKRNSTGQTSSRQSVCNVLDVRANQNDSFIDRERMRAVPNSGEHMTSFNQAEQLIVHGFPKSSDCEMICEEDSHLSQDDAVHHSNNRKQYRGGDNEHLKRNSTGQKSSRQSECNVLDVRANRNDSFIDPERTPNSDEHMTSFDRAEQLTVQGFSDSSDCDVIFDDGDSEHFRRQPTARAVSRLSERNVLADRANRNGEGICAVDNADDGVTPVEDRRRQKSKPHRCEECEASFTRSYNLQVHMRIHSGSKPYRCRVCSKTFHKGDNLRVHMWSHTGERPYCCRHCGKKFTRKGFLMKHKETSCYPFSKEG